MAMLLASESATWDACVLASVVWLLIMSAFLLGKNMRPQSSDCEDSAKAAPPRSRAAPPRAERPADGASAAPLTLPALTAGEEALVARGGLVTKPYRNDGGVNRGIAVQQVSAPPHVVWAALLDFESYPRMVDDVQSVKVYHQDGDETKVAVRVGYGVVGLTTCLHHVYDKALGQLTWSLDRQKPSSFKSNDGFWIVRPADAERSSRVYYSIAVELDAWVPSWINGFVASQGIPRAVAWVKKESESQARQLARMQPAQAQLAKVAHRPVGAGRVSQPDASPLDALLHSFARCFGSLNAHEERLRASRI
jgi:carbon monoxide dehydrogenase subunit G